MSEANPARGEIEISLGDLGKVICRPGFRALQAIDDPKRYGPLSSIMQRLIATPSLGDVVTIIYETHLDSDSKPKHSREAIGNAVLEVGMDTLYSQCAALVGTAWSKRAEKEQEADSGNDEGARSRTVDSPPTNSSPSSSSSSESESTALGE